MDNIEILDKKLCTGCGLCDNVCPFKAIEMKPDDEGFLFPIVNDKCTQCGLCAKSCPQLTPVNNFASSTDCYAVICNNTIREQCSSGGVFGAAAYYALEQGGAVIGAAFDSSFRNVFHCTVKEKESLPKLFKSKYVQSDMGKIYEEIKDILDKISAPVVFCGCPCQADSLRVFLKKDYPNLLIIDLLCHGVPSPLAYNIFLDEVNGDKPITGVDFRDKKGGWGTLLSIKNDKEKIHYDLYNGNYFRAFHSGLAMRNSCFSCKYAQKERVGDITIGDFWGVNEYNKDLNDNQGTSLVLCNTQKGKEFFEYLRKYFDVCEKLTYQKILDISGKTNWALCKPSLKPEMRQCFFHHLKKDSFSRSLKYAEKGLMDVGILGWWIQTNRSNYGSTLTCYALYRFLLSLGLSVAFISPPDFDRENAGEFNKKHGYRMTMKRTYEEMVEHNKFIDTFIVGSDVLWYYDAFIQTKYFFMLDFVHENKKKISYATSFGNTEKFFPDNEILKARSLLNKFDHVSVREFEATKICKDIFAVDAEQVLDPVFLCDKTCWHKIAKGAKRKTQGKFLFSYMIAPSIERAQQLKYAADKLGLQLVTITDNQFNHEQKESILQEYGLISNASIEEVLYHIENADFVISDSYHGICFSLIMAKPFIAVSSRIKNDSRFMTLGHLFNIDKRIVFDLNDVFINNDLLTSMNYNMINPNIQREIDRSTKWLENAIFSSKVKKNKNDADYLVEEILKLRETVEQMKQKIASLENSLAPQ